jgi:hypothetical protein
MRTLFITLLIALSSLSHAEALKAPSMKELIRTLKEAKFSYKETGLVFGYVSIQSCLYTSKDIVVFKNYCFPKKNYPARGLTIISPVFGMMDFYEETRSGMLRREIDLSEFKDVLLPYLQAPVETYTLSQLSELSRNLYYKNHPACWSSDFNLNYQAPHTDCNVEKALIPNYSEWESEAQAFMADDETWDEVFALFQ